MFSEKGHGIGFYKNFRVHVLNAVVGDKLLVKIYRQIKKDLYATNLKVISSSKYRIEPKDNEIFISTSPWQILDFNYEKEIKEQFVEMYFKNHANYNLKTKILFPENLNTYYYRNKIEFGFFIDKNTRKYMFSFFKKGSSKGKIPVKKTSLIPKIMMEEANKILNFLNELNFEYGLLKFLVLRYSFFEKKVIANLLVTDENILKNYNEIKNINKLLNEHLKGIVINYSKIENPSAESEFELISFGETELKEKIIDKFFVYNYKQFFQIYVPMFEFSLNRIIKIFEEKILPDFKNKPNITDLFSGVGVFGISFAKYANNVKCVEISKDSKKYGELNATLNKIKNVEFLECSVDEALETIENTEILILDPPRGGITKKTIKKILKEKPKYIIYLSCNPKTQAMDFNWLKEKYDIIYNEGYDFFPHTPHIEHLIVLKLK
jgi:23S rRNA (uracil1939-C5)-methyltransferase